MTGSSDMQYKLIKEMYTGCEIVMGNLEITMMEPTRDFSFLQVSARPTNLYFLLCVYTIITVLPQWPRLYEKSEM